MTKSKKIGLIILIISALSLPISLSVFVITKFALASLNAKRMETSYMENPRLKYTDNRLEGSPSDISANIDNKIGLGQTDRRTTLYRILNVVLGLFPIVAIVFGIPLGIYFLVRKDATAPSTPPLK